MYDIRGGGDTASHPTFFGGAELGLIRLWNSAEKLFLPQQKRLLAVCIPLSQRDAFGQLVLGKNVSDLWAHEVQAGLCVSFQE
jgi:hypothetical protein